MKKKKTLICPLTKFTKILGGKWKILILFVLSKGETHYGKLHFLIPKISKKVLSENLQLLQENKFIKRKLNVEDNKVYYKLTKRGESITPILKDISAWIKNTYPNENFEP
ncbi:MAG: helix-turn-helix domain-containing protein [Winogradskyella sp.]